MQDAPLVLNTSNLAQNVAKCIAEFVNALVAGNSTIISHYSSN